MTTGTAPRQGRLVAFLSKQGFSRSLGWGFVALTLFMVGDGVELSFLSTYLTERGFGAGDVAFLFSAYGIVVAAGAWLAGALAESWGPRRVMLIGAVVWLALEIVFLSAGVMQGNYTVMVAAYAVRGIGYPFFVYGFLVWVTMETPDAVMGKAVGWYWFFNALGLGVLSGYFVSAFVGTIGELATLWSSIFFVLVAGLMITFLVKTQAGRKKVTRAETVEGLRRSVTIMKDRPKVAIGGAVRLINTISFYSFAVFLNVYMVRTIGFTIAEWASIWATMLLANVIANILAGYAADRFGRINVIAWGGGAVTALTVLGFYYLPQAVEPNYGIIMALGIVYGLALGMYVPLSAVVPLLAPHHKAAAVAVLNLGAGLSNFAGPAVAGLVGPLGVGPVVWILAGLYLVGIFLTFMLREAGLQVPRRRKTRAVVATA